MRVVVWFLTDAYFYIFQPMRPIKASLTTSSPICTVFEFHRIYDKVEELYKVHSQFLTQIEERVANWNLKQIIGDLFTLLVRPTGCFPINLYESYFYYST